MEYIQSLLNSHIRVTLSDSRQVYGTLHCVDNSSNLILHDVKVQLACSTDESSAQQLTSAMVNGKDIIKVELLHTETE